ncbi:MAG: hypothetical protein ACK8QZ_05470, partial [Anaerolineales bacterium]
EQRILAGWQKMEKNLEQAEQVAAQRQQAQQRPTWDMARWKERDYAESARWEAQQAYQHYRQGEWADPQPTSQPKSFWQRAGEWVQQKILQPVQDFAVSVVTTIQNEHQKFQTWNSIRKDYGWTPIGTFSQKELNLIAETGKDISTYVDTLSPGNGKAWVKSYLSAAIVHWPAPLTALGEKYGKKYELLGAFTRPMGLPGMVILPHSWEEGYANPKSMPLAHEFGHVWDARTGKVGWNVELGWNMPPIKISVQGIVGGVADQLNTFIGGTVVEQNGSRFLDESGKNVIPDDYKWEKTDYKFHNSYGDNSTADYLCETFNALIYQPDAIPNPPGGVNPGEWVKSIIKQQADTFTVTQQANELTPPVIPQATPAPHPPTSTPTPTQTPLPQSTITVPSSAPATPLPQPIQTAPVSTSVTPSQTLEAK